MLKSRFWYKSLLLWILKISGAFYKAPSNLSYWWNFGFISLYFLLSQIITGVILAMFYNANSDLAFKIIYNISNEIYYGWWIRYIHSNGASFFFFIVYLHIARNLYYGTYLFPRQLLWTSGMIIVCLMIATAFLGYILPWGQMSFWGAMVITSLVGSIPFVGNDILFLLWGGYSIDNATLHRFYSLHYLLPFLILFLSIVHILLLHEFGSSNPLGLSSRLDNIPFNPYYTLKDSFSIVLLLIFFFIIITLAPDYLGHSDNYIEANPLATPAHIVPEWYFLPLYAVLRSVTNKLLGILFIALFILSFFLLPVIQKNSFLKSSRFRPFYRLLSLIFIFLCIGLGWIGSLPVISPYLELGQYFTVFFFVIWFLFIVNSYIERLVLDIYYFRLKSVIRI